jgi:hypothetical protein
VIMSSKYFIPVSEVFSRCNYFVSACFP